MSAMTVNGGRSVREGQDAQLSRLRENETQHMIKRNGLSILVALVQTRLGARNKVNRGNLNIIPHIYGNMAMRPKKR